MNASMNSLPTSLRTASSGFTLIELMVTIAVLAIIVSIAAPNISTQLANQRVKSTTVTLVNALKEAKAESLIRRQTITLTFDNDGTDTGTIMIDNTAIIASYSYDAKSTISAVDSDSATVTNIEFKPTKTADERVFTICDSNTVASPRRVIVSALGNTTSQIAGTC
ncbi:pilus assembly FimT family protein [Psychrobacter sp. T6-5]|uniref:pilus assembly FimT family protein n=1 Tax=Psychrobacter sp. T6-5 TaxID=3457451 RepID=UPI003FCF9903